ncbi:hypothetical protein Q9L58_002045 [Maublancomyces gigas]|uniref:Uncharacterized protein n=1 Tax=Discina gigas TaxID=1032678 RepID=A0ABR3GT93_9PEZI
MASLPRQHFGHRFEMDGKVEDRELMDEETIDLGSGESINEAKTCLSDQEWRVLHTAQSSSTGPKIQKAKESESYPNHISFKLPVVKIPDAQFFGFSFSPRFEENSRSSKTQELGPTLNPFERIERQGRCSPLNHSQSPPDSRHHSRSSTMGLQAFRLLPSTMKTSKETGDQPPVIPSPPLLPDTTKEGHGSIGSVEGLTMGAKRDSTYGGGLCLGPKSNIEGAFRPNVESLDIKDFDIILPDGQKSRPCESSSADTEASGSGLFNANPISNKGSSVVNRSNSVTLGVGSAYQVDQRKIMVEVQKEKNISSTGPAKNTNTFPEGD